MTQIDLLYRAFGKVAEAMDENRALASFTAAFAKASQKDSVVVTHNVCRVEEDWVAAVERGLVFVGKAIEEDRQFIRSNGEVQPIEKVRHISRESVQHLSRHSDLITRETKEDLIPDKLYTVERLSDYAVYENRFLYVLLLRIRDFVSVRYDAILRAYKTYRGEYKAHKRVSAGSRKFTYSMEFTDEQDDVFSASADPECAGYLARMEKIEQSVAFYLRTPLMQEVSRADKIKNKLTKTNVLRMDKNFKECVALYEFLQAYGKDGYTIRSEVTRLDPIPDDVAREFAVPAVLASFLVYEHGLGIEDSLREEFEREEERRAAQAQLALAEAIKELKKRVEETGEDMERYMLMLEERNAALERDSRLLIEARTQIEALNGTIDALHAEEAVLKQDIEALNDANAKLAEENERAEEAHRQKLEELRREREAAEAAHAAELARAEEKVREEAQRIRGECEERIREAQAKIAEKGKETELALREARDAHGACAEIARECEVLQARLTAIRKEHGLLTAADDFTTEEGFDALEHEFEVLGRLVRDEWTNVKKVLRKEFYGSLRNTVRRKKGAAKKSEEYRRLSAEAKARRAAAGAPAEGADGEENGETDGKAADDE